MNEEVIRREWGRIKEQIREEHGLSNITYAAWIEKLEIADIRDRVVYVRVPSDKPVMLDYLVENYKEIFEAAIAETVDETYSVEFLLTD